MRALVVAVVLAVAAVASAQPPASQPTLVPPVLTGFVEAEYPVAARAAGRTGAVVLTLTIDATGAVSEAIVATTGGTDFDVAALAAARRFRFTPATQDGKPVPVRITYRYVFELNAAPPTTGALVGQIRDRYKKTPLVELDAGARAATDADGRFALRDLAPGTVKVTLSGDAVVTVSTEEPITVGVERQVTYDLEPKADPAIAVDEEEVVRAPRVRKEAVEIALAADEARRIPGTRGDTLKVVQALPGVARAAVGSGQLVVWGAAPEDTRVIVDGIELPALYHLGGWRSLLASRLVAGLELVPGAFGADVGRGLGGLVRVTTAAPPAEGVHGGLAADPLDVGAWAGARVAPGLRVLAAARQSVLDRIAPSVVDPDVGELVPIPRYRDGQLKLALDLDGGTLELLALAADDALTRRVTSSDPEGVREDARSRGTWRVATRYRKLAADGASVDAVLFVGRDDATTRGRAGSITWSLEERAWRPGLRAGTRRRLAPGVVLVLGADVLATLAELSRTGSLTVPPREGDPFVFGQPPGTDVASDSWSATILDVGVSSTVELERGPWRVAPGLRVGPTVVGASRSLPPIGASPRLGTQDAAFSVEPRVAAALKVGGGREVRAAAGLHHQPPRPDELSAVFGTPTLGLERAVAANLGFATPLPAHLDATATVFASRQDQLVARDVDPTPLLAHALTNDGEGRVLGAQLLLRLRRPTLEGWLTYTFSRAQRRRPDEPWRAADHDQPHVASATASWRLGALTLGARARVASGTPRTPVFGASYDARDDRWDPVFGKRNSARLPAFVSLDLRAEHTFTIDRARVSLSLDVENVTNHANEEEWVYSSDFAQRRAIHGLPIFVLAGLRAEL